MDGLYIIILDLYYVKNSILEPTHNVLPIKKKKKRFLQLMNHIFGIYDSVTLNQIGSKDLLMIGLWAHWILRIILFANHV